MMEDFYVAKTYQTWKRVGEPTTNEKGKLSIRVETKCDRCGGTGVMASRVENGHIVPIPVDGGVCYGCNGTGVMSKLVRLYTSREYAAMERAEEKRTTTKEEKAKKDFAKKKAEWLEKNGFSAEGTYVLTGETYSIKDQLKDDGWKFDKVLLWHKADPGLYDERAIFIPIDEIISFSAWGVGAYKEGAVEYIKGILHKDDEPVEESEWFDGDRVSKVDVTLVKKGSFMGRYGLSYIYTFRDEDKHVFVWFTSKDIDIEAGDAVVLSGNVKDRKEYEGVHQTIVTRCTVK